MPALNIITTPILPAASEDADYSDAALGLYLLAEGYATEQAFLTDCYALVKKLLQLAPFNKLSSAATLAIHAAYDDSAVGNPIQVGTQAYDPTAMTSVLGGYFQSNGGVGRGKFYLDYDKLAALTSRVQAWSATQNTYLPLTMPPDSNGISYQYLPGAIVVLTPAVDTQSGLLDAELFQVEQEHFPEENKPLAFVATSANAGCERIVARALAMAWGLGDESEQVPGQPTPEVGMALDAYPNLWYGATPQAVALQVAAPKWQALASQPLTLHAKQDATLDLESSALVDAKIDHWEGGGGYSQGVFRPAHDCIMGLKPGEGPLLMKLSQHPFCPVCYAYLYKAIAGEYTTKRNAEFVKLSTQRSEYNKVFWAIDTQVTAAGTFTVGPGDESIDGPEYDPANDNRRAFWGYTCHLDPGQGFYLQDVRVHQSKYYDSGNNFKKKTSAPTDFRDVFSKVTFDTLTVTFDDAAATTFTFEVADYLQRGDFIFLRSSHGNVGADYLYQSGLKLQLVEQRPGWPRLELELTVVFRSTATDFDPGGAAEALKCYPQIQFKWIPMPGSTLRVKKFDGNVHMVSNAKHYMYNPMSWCGTTTSHFIPGHHDADPGVDMANMAGFGVDTLSNDVSCFTDSNISALYGAAYFPANPQAMARGSFNTKMRRQSVEYSPPFNKPTWAALFDYYYPHAATYAQPKKTFVGVYDRNTATRHADIRKLYVQHPIETEAGKPIVYDNIFITKFARQGAYDNLHVNGNMGNHVGFAGDPTHFDVQDIANEPVVAAPFCGQDCFHLHWRWSLFSETTAHLAPGIVPSSFRGWSDERSHSIVGAPLIPPNQQLTINLQYQTEEWKASFQYQTQELKAIDYHVTISEPAPHENQVILEQGTGWAMTYADFPFVNIVENAVLSSPPIPHNLLATSDPVTNVSLLQPNHEEAFTKIYDFIRFHHSYQFETPAHITALKMKIHKHVQVPAGDDVPTMTWPGNDVFVDYYKAHGDLYNSALYTEAQLVVDGAQHPELSGVTLEEM